MKCDRCHQTAVTGCQSSATHTNTRECFINAKNSQWLVLRNFSVYEYEEKKKTLFVLLFIFHSYWKCIMIIICRNIVCSAHSKMLNTQPKLMGYFLSTILGSWINYIWMLDGCSRQPLKIRLRLWWSCVCAANRKFARHLPKTPRILVSAVHLSF